MRADVGIALDGDADGVLIADERGRIVYGDQLLAVIAESWKAEGRLARPGIVATVMSNLGLERYLGTLDIELARTPVGDRYVLEHMRSHDYNVGGELSGHIILSDYTTTGDGLLAAFQVLAAVKSRVSRFQSVPSLRSASASSAHALQERQAAREYPGSQRHQGRGSPS